MPAYNGEKYIGESIESTQAQTLQDWELIIVDDCSTDSTITVIEPYLKDKRIRLFRNEENLGIAASRNLSISKARGKYIAIQDDDDISFPTRLQDEAAFLDEHADIDAVAGHWLKVDENGKTVLNMFSAYKNPKYVKAHLIFSDCIGNGSTMFRKEFVTKNTLRYRDNMLGMEDYYFWIEFSRNGNISAIDEIVYKQRVHNAQESQRKRQASMNERQLLFASFQQSALSMYGIEISEKSKQALERLAGEFTNPNANANDYCALYEAFREIIEKAYTLELDFADEIAIACRKHLGKKIANSKGFWR